MDSGSMVEFGSPYDLLIGKPDGHFSRMIHQTGDVMAKILLNSAVAAHRREDSRGQNGHIAVR